MPPPNTTCTGRWGFAAVFEHFPPFEFSLLPSIVHAHPAASNAGRWAAARSFKVCYSSTKVEDIEAVVAKLKKKGAELFGEIQNYEDTYKLCYVRGPEGIILELAEKIK